MLDEKDKVNYITGPRAHVATEVSIRANTSGAIAEIGAMVPRSSQPMRIAMRWARYSKRALILCASFFRAHVPVRGCLGLHPGACGCL